MSNTRAVGMLVLFSFILVMAATWDRIGNRNLTLVMLYAFIMLSLVPLPGWSGQISIWCGRYPSSSGLWRGGRHPGRQRSPFRVPGSHHRPTSRGCP